MGDARMRVNNVSVWAGNVTAWVTVEWGAPLCVYTHYLAVRGDDQPVHRATRTP